MKTYHELKEKFNKLGINISEKNINDLIEDRMSQGMSLSEATDYIYDSEYSPEPIEELDELGEVIQEGLLEEYDIDEAAEDQVPNPWEIWTAYIRQVKHPIRPVLIINVDTTRVSCCLCGHDELRSQRDGSIKYISRFYQEHPEFNITPYVLTDRAGTGLHERTYVNINRVIRLHKSMLRKRLGHISATDCKILVKVLEADDIVPESILATL